jgi:acylphosphatase
MFTYKLLKRPNETVAYGVIRINEDGSSVSFLLNTDSIEVEAYQAWLANGNTPQAAD